MGANIVFFLGGGVNMSICPNWQNVSDRVCFYRGLPKHYALEFFFLILGINGVINYISILF